MISRTDEDLEKGEEEPEILVADIEPAIKKLKTKMAVGVPAESLKAGGATVVTAMKGIIDSIWRTGEWFEDWTISELALISPRVKIHQTSSL